MTQIAYKIQMFPLVSDICSGWLDSLGTTGREQESQLMLASACSPVFSLSNKTWYLPDY